MDLLFFVNEMIISLTEDIAANCIFYNSYHIFKMMHSEILDKYFQLESYLKRFKILHIVHLLCSNFPCVFLFLLFLKINFSTSSFTLCLFLFYVVGRRHWANTQFAGSVL